jgi:hypothetical protein
MSFFKFVDAYTLRARLLPAVIAAAPALAAFALLISWQKIALSNMVATGALLVLLFALADFARKQGLRVEPKIYKEMGGKPSVTMMRRTGDETLDANTKEKYRTFLAGKVKHPAPTAEMEAANQAEADAFYEQCGVWMRSNTRDAKRFPILFNELVIYGFRRNLLGLKWSALTLNLIVVAASCGLLWHRGIWDMTDDLTMRTTVVLVVSCIHALYIAFVVTRGGVKEAARKYARELILCCEALSGTAKMTASPRKPRGKATAT